MSGTRKLILRLIGFQLIDAAVVAVALYDLAPSTSFGQAARRWARDDLDHLGFPRSLRFVLPIVKSSSALGLVLGLWRPRLGRITAGALIAYFVAAIGFHRRAHDSVAKTAPATAMLVWSAAAWRAFPASP